MKNPTKNIFQCPECGSKYKEKEWADKCEDWCKDHGTSCDLEVVKYAIMKEIDK
jgi:hypothetical protein